MTEDRRTELRQRVVELGAAVYRLRRELAEAERTLDVALAAYGAFGLPPGDTLERRVVAALKPGCAYGATELEPVVGASREVLRVTLWRMRRAGVLRVVGPYVGERGRRFDNLPVRYALRPAGL